MTDPTDPVLAELAAISGDAWHVSSRSATRAPLCYRNTYGWTVYPRDGEWLGNCDQRAIGEGPSPASALRAAVVDLRQRLAALVKQAGGTVTWPKEET